MPTNPPWKQYQEDVAIYFRELGFDAQTDVVLPGVRTEHAIDVVVRSALAGFQLFWLIECKHWASAVPKGPVLLLKQIVAEVGADRGILMSERGFQSGAHAATSQSNVQLSSLAHLKLITSEELGAQKIAQLYARYSVAKELFWEIPKHVRMAYSMRVEGARPDEYPGFFILTFAEEVLAKAHRKAYPIQAHILATSVVLSNAREVQQHVDPLLKSLETRLDLCLQDQPNWPADEDAAFERVIKTLKASKGLS
jgi:hypothetical protein